MKNLLNFLRKYNYWFLFLLLELVGGFWLFRHNRYQQSVYFTSANAVSGAVYRVSGKVNSYFHLQEANRELLEHNMLLRQELDRLRHELKTRQLDSLTIDSLQCYGDAGYEVYAAQVINNSLNRSDNYLTLNRGSLHGIRPEMGVVGSNGVVGIIYAVSPSYSLALSVLSTKSGISCKIKKSDYFGYLKWERGDSRFAFLRDLPRHAEFAIGDTVVTSGYSTVFPEGIMVGTVADKADSNDGLSYLLKIKLSTDFGRLSEVAVMGRTERQELKELEKATAE